MKQLLGASSPAQACRSALLTRHRALIGGWLPAVATLSHQHHRPTSAPGHRCTIAAAADCGRTRAVGPALQDITRVAASASASGSSNSSSSSGTHHHMRGVAARATGGRSGASEGGQQGFWTLQSYVLFESEVKKSKFVVHAWPVSSPSEALTLIRGASDPGASHNCFAYRVGQEARCTDDGEPGGTAGRPIQAAIDGEGLDRVAVLVTRYFGGIKLGAGGLVRAYGGAAKECLRLAPRVFAKAQSEVAVEVTYDELGVVYGCLDAHSCTRLAEDYGSSGTVSIRALVDADRLESLKTAVADGTGGRRRVELASSQSGATVAISAGD